MITAMKQALEALEDSVDLVQYEYDHAVEMYGQYPTRAGKINGLLELLEAHKNSITTLRQAIEQAGSVEPVAWDEAVEKATENANYVFKDSCNHTAQAIDYMKALMQYTHPPTAPAQPDEQLLKFYGVYDYPGLVAAMEKHIEKLQSKLPTNPQTAIDAWNNRVPTAPAQPEPVASILICAESSGEFEAVIELDHPLPIGTKLYTHPTAPAQDLSRLEPFVHGLGKAILRELQAAPVQQPLNDFDIRGVLASRLLCWHRLTEAEAQDLICFFEGVRKPAAPAHPELPVNWAAMIHYPECWDTAVYPELRHAIHEVLACSGCSVCNPTAPAQQEVHDALCLALTGGKCTCSSSPATVDKAWSQFCGGIGRGPDAPYPGMIEAFEAHYGQSFTDKDWRNETGIWAAAWGYAVRRRNPPTAPAQQPLTEEQIDFAWFKAMKSTPGTALPINEFARAIEAAHGIKGASL